MPPRKGWKWNKETRRYEPSATEPTLAQGESEMEANEIGEIIITKEEIEVKEPKGPKPRKGTLVTDVGTYDQIFAIQVVEGFCVTTQSIDGEKKTYFGGYSHQLDMSEKIDYVYLYADPTNQLDHEPEDIVAILMSEREVSGVGKMLASYVFTHDSLRIVALPLNISKS